MLVVGSCIRIFLSNLILSLETSTSLNSLKVVLIEEVLIYGLLIFFAFATIGNSSCAEGHFWEAVNAIGVLQVPAIISVWDDEYGIEVVDTLMHHVIYTKKEISNPFGFMKVSLPNWNPENTQSRKRKKKREMPKFMEFAITNVNTAEEPFIVTNKKTGEIKINGLTEEMIMKLEKICI